MALATRGGEQANQEKADSNFNKCPQLLVLGNVTSKAEVPGNTPELHFACESAVAKTLHTYSHCPSSTAVLTNCFGQLCALLLPVDTSVGLSAVIFFQAHFEPERKRFSCGKSCSKQRESV